MAQNLFRTVQRLLTDGGALAPNASVEVFVAGSSEPAQLYSDRGLTATAGYVVIADAAGAVPERWLPDGILFKLIYKDAQGAVKYTRDYANDANDAGASRIYHTPTDAGIDGDTAADVAGALQDWMDDVGGGHIFDLEGKTYLIGSRIVPPAGTATRRTVIRNGCIKAHSSVGAGLVMVAAVNYCTLETTLTIDGDQQGVSTDAHYGAANSAALSGFHCHALFQGLSFAGVYISDNNRAWTNSDIDLSGTRVQNVGWVGINAETCPRLQMHRVSVERTGYDAIRTVICEGIASHGAYVSKETAPYVIFTAGGGVETGFFWGHIGCSGSITGFFFDDNLTAGFDGIGLLEDGAGPLPESGNLHWQGHVHKCGGAAYDPSSNSTFDLIITESALYGIFFAQDLGGTLENISGRAVIQDMDASSVAAVTFASPSEIVTTISTINGSPTATIASATFVAIGQRIYSANVPGGATITNIVGTTITMSANATATAGGTAVTFRAFTHWKNINVDVIVDNAPKGVTVFDGTLGGNAHGTYDNVRVNYQGRSVTTDILVFPTATEPAGIVIDNHTIANDDPTLGEEWNSSSGAVTASSGAITTANGTVRWLLKGRTVYFKIDVSITINGTGAGAVLVALPISIRSTIFCGREYAVIGNMVMGNAVGTSMVITNTDGSYPGANGRSFFISGVAEAN